MPENHDPECYTLSEIAAAAGVAEGVVLDLAARGSIPTLGSTLEARPLDTLVEPSVAVEAVRALAAGTTPGGHLRSALAVAASTGRPTGMPVLVSMGLHGAVALVMAAIASLGLSLRAEQPADESSRMSPFAWSTYGAAGPGRGGGGERTEAACAATQAQRKGTHSLASPLPARELPPPAPAPTPVEPPKPLDARMLPPVVAPVAPAASDARGPGRRDEGRPRPERSRRSARAPGPGPGPDRAPAWVTAPDPASATDRAAGRAAVPYRPGSGVEPPRLLREVKASY
ncbi:MAG: hypothetical protein R2708_28900 [Vicinamibacterales bacterium]